MGPRAVGAQALGKGQVSEVRERSRKSFQKLQGALF